MQAGLSEQTLLGVTGSGKTFTMANIIATGAAGPRWCLRTTRRWQRSCAREFREFFPDNAVEYFVSYYDYYQPEAYIAADRTPISKRTPPINDEIDKLRHSATSALFRAAGRHHRGLASPAFTAWATRSITEHGHFAARRAWRSSRDELLRKLVDIQYERNDINFIRNKFRVRGDVLEIFPA